MSTLRVLQVRALSKTFAGGLALDNVDLDIETGEIRALLGENGSGKSTLIKIISGYYRPDTGGEVLIGDQRLKEGDPTSAHKLGARFVHQELGMVETLSALDNLCIGFGYPTKRSTINRKEALRRAKLALAQVELDINPELLVSSLTPAQKTGVAVARALQPLDGVAARLLVLDEPTARLPEHEVDHLLNLVRVVAKSGVAVLYVTHRLDEVFGLAKSASVLRDGRKVFEGQVSTLSRESLLKHLFGSLVEREVPIAARDSDGLPLLSVRNLGSDLLGDVSFEVFPGEIVGITGITGSGRESLCSTLFGSIPRDRGEVYVDGKLLSAGRPVESIESGVAYVPAERKIFGIFPELTATENISISGLGRFWRFPYLRSKLEQASAINWFDRLSIRPFGGTNKLISNFSGGNQQKVVFSRWFEYQSKLFLLDEPTQGVDVSAKSELHKCLVSAAESGAAIVMSSSDTEEITVTCNRALVMHNGNIVAELRGSAISPQGIARAVLAISDANNER